jgi:hypothetical protein
LSKTNIMDKRNHQTNPLGLPGRFFFHGQLQHLLFILVLVPGALFLAEPAVKTGAWMGFSGRQWLHAMLGVVVLHQVLVALVFRAQLIYSVMTRIFGRHDMTVWGILFLPLLLLRVITLLGLGIATQATLPLPGGISLAVAVLLLLPALYTLWSVFRYFGLARALGGDHFRQKYREMPLVKKGAFRYSSNAMYVLGFLLLWAVALLTRSQAALAGALFQHAYIWVHWYCTEKPDMEKIYP